MKRPCVSRILGSKAYVDAVRQPPPQTHVLREGETFEQFTEVKLQSSQVTDVDTDVAIQESILWSPNSV